MKIILILIALLLIGCEGIERRALIIDGDIRVDGIITDIEAGGNGCYVGTSEQNPDGCIRFNGESCTVTLGECPDEN